MKHFRKPYRKTLLSLILALSLSLTSAAVCFASDPGQSGNSTVSAQAASNTSKLVRIGKTTFDLSKEAGAWKNGSGWKNDLDNGYIKMVNFDGSGVDFTTSEVDVTVAMSGLNRLSTISAGGRLNIIGTGILLVDKIEMAKGAELNLLPDKNIHKKGSVALFLKQTDGTYQMINNASVPGVLDEAYTLPKNTHLVVPSGSELELSAMLVKTEEYEDKNGKTRSEVTYYVNDAENYSAAAEHGGCVSTDFTVGQLTVPASSSLTIAKKAAAKINRVYLAPGYIAAKIDVKGTLAVTGTVDGGVLSVGEGAVLKGNGTISKCSADLFLSSGSSEDITYQKCRLYLNGIASGKKPGFILDDTRLNMRCAAAAFSALTVSGVSRLSFTDGSAVDQITVKSGGKLELAGLKSLTEGGVLTLNGSVSGGSLAFLGGRFVIGKKAVISSNTGITAGEDKNEVIIYDKSEKLPASDFPAVITAKRAAAMLEESTDAVTVAYEEVLEWRDVDSEYGCEIIEQSGGIAAQAVPRGENNATTLDDVFAAQGVPSGIRAQKYVVEALRMDGGELTVSVYEKEGEPIDLDGVFLLRAIWLRPVNNGEGGGTTTSTNTAFTGTGVLGGSGYFSGGVSTTVFRGTGRSDPGFGDNGGGDNGGGDNGGGDNGGGDNGGDNNGGGNNGGGNNGGGNNGGGNNSGGNNWSGQNSQTSKTDPDRDESVEERKTVVTEKEEGQYELKVYEEEAELTDLEGHGVTAEVPFPEGEENSRYYIVFDEDGTGKWIPAVFDPVKKVLTFASDRTGSFRIARVTVEDVTFASATTEEPIYWKLSVWIGQEELTAWDDPVTAEAVLPSGGAGGANLYAVFVDDYEELQILPAKRSETGGTCHFEAGAAGDFVIVSFDEAYTSGSDELYEACSASDEVRILIAVKRLYAFWS